MLLHAPARKVLPFAGDGTVTAVGDKRCKLEVGSWSWGARAASFGRFEVAMEVVEPVELVEAFAVQAGRFAAAGSFTGAREEASGVAQPLRYALSVTFDGRCSHEAGPPSYEESTAFWTDELRRSDTLRYAWGERMIRRPGLAGAVDRGPANLLFGGPPS
ncbi:hypothetical protein [Microbacterium enclense]|uniref:hypothetical protein n=1 Tax=Microbacterium enclense TaxID=993073 RepID=UPI003F7EC962